MKLGQEPAFPQALIGGQGGPGGNCTLNVDKEKYVPNAELNANGGCGGIPISDGTNTGMTIRQYYIGQILASIATDEIYSSNVDPLCNSIIELADKVLAEEERTRK